MIQMNKDAALTPATPPPPQTPTRLPNPNSYMNGASLSRSNSSASWSTTASSDGMSTPPSQLSTPSSECPPLSRNKRTPQSQESIRLAGAMNYTHGDRLADDMLWQDQTLTPQQQLSQDRRDILRPILNFFDPWLAPRRSPLFIFEKKKQQNPDGTFSLKKNESLNLRLWTKLSRTALKKIMGPAYRNNHVLTSRFRFAAKKIICKRRANHVQHWRLFKTHKDMIYSDGAKLRPKKSSKGRMSQLRKRINFEVPATHDGQDSGYNSDVNHDKDEDSCDTIQYDEIEDEDVPEGEDVDIAKDADLDVAKNADVDVAKDADVNVAKDADVDVAKKGPSPPPVSIKYEVKTKCCMCQKPLECKSAFPQDHEDWACSVNRPMRCVKCWNEHVQQTLMPDMQEKISQQSLRKTKKNAKKKKKTCRCGSTDHSMTTSLNCPLNKRNLVTECEPQAPPKKKSKKSTAPPKRKRKKSVAPKRKRKKSEVPPRKKKSKKSAKECKTPPKKSDDPTLFLTQPTTPQNFYQCTTDIGDGVGIGGYFESTPGENATTTSTTSPLPRIQPPIQPPQPPIQPPLPLPAIQRYALGDNVEAKFVGRQKYLGHVIGYNNGRYSVYFLDGTVKRGIRERDISAYDGNYPTRAEMINRDFFDHGDEDFAEGTFRVRQIVDNEFKCIRLTGSGTGQLTNFDVGYVIKMHQEQLCDQREKGIGHVLTSRTRGGSRV